MKQKKIVIAIKISLIFVVVYSLHFGIATIIIDPAINPIKKNALAIKETNIALVTERQTVTITTNVIVRYVVLAKITVYTLIRHIGVTAPAFQ